MFNRLSIAGSLIGGIKETQEVVDLCFKHGIYPDCQVIEAKEIDWAWDKLINSNAVNTVWTKSFTSPKLL